jgi:hypothetical protein
MRVLSTDRNEMLICDLRAAYCGAHGRPRSDETIQLVSWQSIASLPAQN